MLFFVDARIQPGADIAPLLQLEIEGVEAMRREGFIKLLLRRQDGTGAYLLVEDSSRDRAQGRLDALPFPSDGLMEMRLEPVDEG